MGSLSAFTPTASVDGIPAVEDPKPPLSYNIAWVSFHPADDQPSTAAMNDGFTEAPDVGYTDLLKSAGHSVTRIVQSVVEKDSPC